MSISLALRLMITGAIALMVIYGCGGRHRPGPEPGGGANEASLDWIYPVDDEAVADTVRAEVLARGMTPTRIALVVNDSIVAERSGPPWLFRHLPKGSEALHLRMRSIAYSAVEGSLEAAQIEVSWEPNLPPEVRIVNLGTRRALERLSGNSLAVQAIDPEEGRLTGESLIWSSSLQGLIGYGERIPVLSLMTGEHRIGVRATDRWRRSGWASADLLVFDYKDGTTPEGTLENMLNALISRDPRPYEGAMSPAFRFVFCVSDRPADASIPADWDRSDETSFIRSILTSEGNELLAADWVIGSIQGALIDGRTLMKAELVGINLCLVHAAGDTTEVINGSARVYLGRIGNDGRWFVETWRESGVGSATSQGRLRLTVGD